MLELAGVKLYTVEEVAKMLQIAEATVRKYIKAGKLEANRIGRPYMVSEESLRNLLTGKEGSNDA
jgi:excisionase family DNA binding protein